MKITRTGWNNYGGEIAKGLTKIPELEAYIQSHSTYIKDYSYLSRSLIDISPYAIGSTQIGSLSYIVNLP